MIYGNMGLGASEQDKYLPMSWQIRNWNNRGPINRLLDFLMRRKPPRGFK